MARLPGVCLPGIPQHIIQSEIGVRVKTKRASVEL